MLKTDQEYCRHKYRQDLRMLTAKVLEALCIAIQITSYVEILCAPLLHLLFPSPPSSSCSVKVFPLWGEFLSASQSPARSASELYCTLDTFITGLDWETRVPSESWKHLQSRTIRHSEGHCIIQVMYSLNLCCVFAGYTGEHCHSISGSIMWIQMFRADLFVKVSLKYCEIAKFKLKVVNSFTHSLTLCWY